MTGQLEFRVSWEMPDAHVVADIEAAQGEGCWPTYDWATLGRWHGSTSKVTTNPWDQYRTLKAWAETRAQPIRNVVLESRPVATWTAVHQSEMKPAPAERSADVTLSEAERTTALRKEAEEVVTAVVRHDHALTVHLIQSHSEPGGLTLQMARLVHTMLHAVVLSQGGTATPTEVWEAWLMHRRAEGN